MISYSIDAALQSGLFSEVIVSTDDPQIAEISKKLGARVPFNRPTDISDDHTPLAGVLAHALEYVIKEESKRFDAVCCILATAPFISVDDLKKSYDLLRKGGTNAVIPVTSFPFPIFRAQKIATDGSLQMVWPEHEMTRSNDLPETFHDVGQFYWLNIENFLKEKKIYAKGARPFIIPRHRVQDIDTPEDWARAELIFKAIHLHEKAGAR